MNFKTAEFLQQVKGELQKVTWPTRKEEVMKSVIVVSVMTFVLIFGGVAFISSQVGREAGPDPELLAERQELENLRIGLDAEMSTATQVRERLRALQAASTTQAALLSRATTRLDSLVGDLESRRREWSEDRERSTRHLAKVYENMKPGQAAPILAGLEMETVVDILARMKERNAARILASMDAQYAAVISARLSEGGRG